MKLSVFVLLAVVLVTGTVFAGDPWSDDSFPVEREAAIKVLRECRDASRAVFDIEWAKLNAGPGWSSLDRVADAQREYFRNNARLAWAEGDFEASYRATEFARLSADKTMGELRALIERGIVDCGTILKAQRERFDSDLVLLRYQGEAQRRGMEFQPVTAEMVDNHLEEIATKKRTDSSQVIATLLHPDLGPDPWTSDSYTIDQQLEAQVLQPYHDDWLRFLAYHRARLDRGMASSTAVAFAQWHYCLAAARLAWSKGDFEASYRATEIARYSADRLVDILNTRFHAGQGKLDQLLVAQRRCADIGIVLLRYIGEAERRGVDIRPACTELTKERLEEISTKLRSGPSPNETPASNEELGPNPWTCDSYAIDREGKAKVLQDYYDASLDVFSLGQARYRTAGLSSMQLALAQWNYYCAAARLAWARSDFSVSYRATEFARFSADDVVNVFQRAYEEGAMSSVEQALATQRLRVETNLVLLRYQGEAKRRGLEIQPASREMMVQDLQRIVSEYPHEYREHPRKPRPMRPTSPQAKSSEPRRPSPGELPPLQPEPTELHPTRTPAEASEVQPRPSSEQLEVFRKPFSTAPARPQSNPRKPRRPTPATGSAHDL